MVCEPRCSLEVQAAACATLPCNVAYNPVALAFCLPFLGRIGNIGLFLWSSSLLALFSHPPTRSIVKESVMLAVAAPLVRAPHASDWPANQHLTVSFSLPWMWASRLITAVAARYHRRQGTTRSRALQLACAPALSPTHQRPPTDASCVFSLFLPTPPRLMRPCFEPRSAPRTLPFPAATWTTMQTVILSASVLQA